MDDLRGRRSKRETPYRKARQALGARMAQALAGAAKLLR
jgi:hypothetical protein